MLISRGEAKAQRPLDYFLISDGKVDCSGLESALETAPLSDSGQAFTWTRDRFVRRISEERGGAAEQKLSSIFFHGLKVM